METPTALGIIAGSGVYPLLLAEGARAAGVQRICAAAFTGETDNSLGERADEVEWLRVGQLGRLLHYFAGAGIRHAVMAGQIAPKNLFDLRPDWKALLLIAKLDRRNAETIFAAIGEELQKIGVTLLPATTFMEKSLAPAGLIAGPKLSRRETADIEFGRAIAKSVSAADIGQTIVVKNGTVLAVEAFEGTDDAIRRGGSLGKSGAVVLKVSKPNQDMRFDVPAIGRQTIAVAAAAKIRVLALEAGRTLLLEKEAVRAAAQAAKITIIGLEW